MSTVQATSNKILELEEALWSIFRSLKNQEWVNKLPMCDIKKEVGD